MAEVLNHPVPVEGTWVGEHMPDGSFNAYSPFRGVAFTIPEALLMATFMVLEGKESYTSQVVLELIGESDDGDVRWSLCVGNVAVDMNEPELTEFFDVLKEACHY